MNKPSVDDYVESMKEYQEYFKSLTPEEQRKEAIKNLKECGLVISDDGSIIFPR